MLHAEVLFQDAGIDVGSGNTGSTCFAIALGDVDGDGDLDAFTTQYHVTRRLWRNNGTGAFTRDFQTFGGQSAHGAALADLDGDADPDIYLQGGGALDDTVWFNDGAGNYDDSGQRLGAGAGWGALRSATSTATAIWTRSSSPTT